MATGKAAFVIHWKSLRRQIRVTGSVEQVLMPRVMLITRHARAAAALEHGLTTIKTLANRGELAAAVNKIADNYPDEVPRPPHWGGFLIRPADIEFWADGDFRLHDRFRFTTETDGHWVAQRLYP